MHIGLIGLGNVGGKLAGSLLRNGYRLTVRDLDESAVVPFVRGGAAYGESPSVMARDCDAIITCLPSPAASDAVLEAEDCVLAGLTPGPLWCEMSTTDESEVRRLGALVEAGAGHAVDCPVSGGCHRAATGNISIFAGCERATFERVLPLLTVLGRRVLHTGPRAVRRGRPARRARARHQPAADLDRGGRRGALRRTGELAEHHPAARGAGRRGSARGRLPVGDGRRRTRSRRTRGRAAWARARRQPVIDGRRARHAGGPQRLAAAGTPGRGSAPASATVAAPSSATPSFAARSVAAATRRTVPRRTGASGATRRSVGVR